MEGFMKQFLYLILITLLASPASAIRGIASVPTKPIVLMGFVSLSPNKKSYILHTSHQSYHLERKGTFIANQKVLKKLNTKLLQKIIVDPRLIQNIYANNAHGGTR